MGSVTTWLVLHQLRAGQPRPTSALHRPLHERVWCRGQHRMAAETPRAQILVLSFLAPWHTDLTVKRRHMAASAGLVSRAASHGGVHGGDTRRADWSSPRDSATHRARCAVATALLVSLACCHKAMRGHRQGPTSSKILQLLSELLACHPPHHISQQRPCSFRLEAARACTRPRVRLACPQHKPLNRNPEIPECIVLACTP